MKEKTGQAEPGASGPSFNLQSAIFNLKSSSVAAKRQPVLGEFFAHLGQECARFIWQFDRLKLELGGYEKELAHMIGDLLPRYFYQLDQKILLKEFTIGFHVEARRSKIGFAT